MTTSVRPPATLPDVTAVRRLLARESFMGLDDALPTGHAARLVALARWITDRLPDGPVRSRWTEAVTAAQGAHPSTASIRRLADLLDGPHPLHTARAARARARALLDAAARGTLSQTVSLAPRPLAAVLGIAVSDAAEVRAALHHLHPHAGVHTRSQPLLPWALIHTITAGVATGQYAVDSPVAIVDLARTLGVRPDAIRHAARTHLAAAQVLIQPTPRQWVIGPRAQPRTPRPPLPHATAQPAADDLLCSLNRGRAALLGTPARGVAAELAAARTLGQRLDELERALPSICGLVPHTGVQHPTAWKLAAAMAPLAVIRPSRVLLDLLVAGARRAGDAGTVIGRVRLLTHASRCAQELGMPQQARRHSATAYALAGGRVPDRELLRARLQHALVHAAEAPLSSEMLYEAASLSRADGDLTTAARAWGVAIGLALDRGEVLVPSVGKQTTTLVHRIREAADADPCTLAHADVLAARIAHLRGEDQTAQAVIRRARLLAAEIGAPPLQMQTLEAAADMTTRTRAEPLRQEAAALRTPAARPGEHPLPTLNPSTGKHRRTPCS